MRILTSAAIAALMLVACGQPAATADAQAQTQSSHAATAPALALGNADKTAILSANHLAANAHGLVRNACGDMVTPQFIRADVGLGNTILFVMVGGPNGGYTCYGDGPDLHLMKQDNGVWREIYANAGGYMVILSSTHNGAHDLAFGGPGMQHPRYSWNGRQYMHAGDIPDEQIGNAAVLPND
jgi:hypothetical protein